MAPAMKEFVSRRRWAHVKRDKNCSEGKKAQRDKSGGLYLKELRRAGRRVYSWNWVGGRVGLDRDGM